MSCCHADMPQILDFGRVGLAVFRVRRNFDFALPPQLSRHRRNDMRRFAASPPKVPALGRHPNDAKAFIDDDNLCCRLLQSVCGGGTLTATKQTNDD